MSVKIRSIMWELAPLLPVATTALFCYLWLAQVVPANDQAAWVSAVATVAALITAGVAAAAALGQLRLLRVDAEERAKDARLAQARGVYLTTAPPSHLDKSSSAKVVLYNNSTEPIDRISLYLRTPGEAMDIHVGSLTPTGLTGHSPAGVEDLVAKHIRPWQMKLVEEPGRKSLWGPGCYEMRMTFRDSGGRWWLRREGQPLIEIKGAVDDYIPRTPLTR